MANSSESVRRHFLPWDRPLMPQAVEYLSKDWDGAGPLDLAKWLVVVPTQQSGRRLREALAEHAASRGQAVLPPRVLTPEALLSAKEGDVASRVESQLAWTEIFRSIDLEEFREVFPIDPPERDFSWALRLARQFMQLQSRLAESGLRLTDVASKAGDVFPEVERWQQLGELETLYAEQLAEAGLRDAQAAKIEITKGSDALHAFDRIALLATPDPLPLAVTWLATIAERRPVDVVVYAPPTEAQAFDRWGRPLEAEWANRVIDVPEFAQRVQLCADPEAQADRVVEIAGGMPSPEGVLSIGVADTEVLPLVENALSRADITAFNPEGRKRQHDGLFALLAALAEFATEASFDAAATLLRCPDIQIWLRTRAGAAIYSPAKVLAQLDDLRSRHLPPTVAAALTHADSFPAVAPVLSALVELRATLTSGAFPQNAAAALTTIFEGRKINSTTPLADSATEWTETLREVGVALAIFEEASLSLPEKWQLVLGEFGAKVRTVDRPAGSLDLLGWLELLWEDAPHLVVAGFNEGSVPDVVIGDAFVPESLRHTLGLRTNEARFARDAYLLTALAASRKSGRLDLLVGKSSLVGEARRPSRLLLRCADAELPGRVAQLFRSIGSARPNLPWTRAWKLRPPALAKRTTVEAAGVKGERTVRPLERVPVTGMRDYLACPFRFYLKHVLRAQRLDPTKAELDARDFGTLLHATLQQLAEEETLSDCTEGSVLRDFLLERFDALASARYGTELTLPLVVQFESARQRLRAAAAVEAREREAGWRTVRAEWKFSFPLGELMVTGKIDRIDRHTDGRVRLLDYKTSDAAAEPAKAHWRGVRPADHDQPDWTRWRDEEGKTRVWVDLQLPLYRRAVAAEFGDAVACGYFNLPKATGETAVVYWNDFSRESQAAAERCADGVVTAVAAGKFWPPSETARPEWDEFAELFHHGAAESVAWNGASAGPAQETIVPS